MALIDQVRRPDTTPPPPPPPTDPPPSTDCEITGSYCEKLTGKIEYIPRKLDALAEHCEQLGRDRSEIVVTKLMMEEAEADLDAIATVKGWNDDAKDLARRILIFGDADTVGERIAGAVAMGLDGITVDLPVNGHKLDRIELLGRIALEALG